MISAPPSNRLFKPIVVLLLDGGDPYMVLADFELYIECQRRASLTYLDPEGWTRKCILNVAQMGRFWSDRTVMEYVEEIWDVRPVIVKPSQHHRAAGASSDPLQSVE